MSRVNQLSLQAGDSLLFRRGDTFSGTLVIRKSGTSEKPLFVGAYGQGAKPRLTGAVPVKNWVNVGNNRWQAACSTCGDGVTGVYRNGLPLPLGRYPNPDAPNRGYLTVQSHTGATQLTSQQALTTNWTGAEVVLFPTYWIIDRATITKQTNNTLTLNNSSTYGLTDNWGFLIQNHPATLDQPGEWYYNPANQTVLLYANSGNPNTETITATAFDRAIDISNSVFITIKGLNISEAKHENLYANTVSNLVLIDNDFSRAGENGLVFSGSGTNILVEKNSISHINNNGVYIADYQKFTFRNNTIRDVGVLPNRGKSGDGQFTGFQSFATQNTLIENNVIDSVGYIGLSVSSNSIIRQNLISNFCMAKSDGGGIYLWNGAQLPLQNIQIQSNIIQKGVGTFGPLSATEYTGAHGVFLDDCVKSVTMTDNTITDCHGLGIYLHAVNHVKLIRNTSFNNTVGQLILYNYDAPCLPRDNVLNQNILVAKTATQSVVGYISGANDLSRFGQMTQNYYARPFNDVFTIRSVYNRTVVNDLSLAQWQAQFGQDGMSKSSPITYKDYRIKSLKSANLLANSFASTNEGWTTWSPYNNGQASWTNAGLLDGGSLQLGFSTASGHADSYVLAYKNIQTIAKSKTYLLRFEARALALKKIVVFIRQQNSPYQDLSRRYELLVEPTKKSYELALTALANETNALLTVQLQEDNQSVWLDNVSLQETTIESVNPSEWIKLVYNPTLNDSLIVLSSPYRDVKNRYYARQILLKPFSSAVLLRDSLPPVDVSLTLKTDRTSVKIGDVVSFSLSLHNESTAHGKTPSQVQWACRIPASLTMVNQPNVSPEDSLLRGTVQKLLTDTTIVFRMRATAAGDYRVAAQVTASTYADPDSTPDSGTDDGEDDRAVVGLLVRHLTAADTTATAIVTATEPLAGSTNHAVYPNPTGHEFSFIAEADIMSIRLTDMLGRECFLQERIRRDQLIQFGQQLSTGYYLLSIQYKTGEQRTVKLLKMGGL
ncbi:right-handed parallel beta-helix repeat-containing protein [Spirosoma humi]